MSSVTWVMMYDQIKEALRQAYDKSATLREASALASWKIAERDDFLRRLKNESRKNILELGAGVGKDSKFFQDNGLKTISIDLSPEMVALCREKGLDAHVMDFMNLDFPENSFDALYAMNSLLHVPPENLPSILQAVKQPLKQSGLFFLGVYGGFNQASIWDADHHNPQRFFAFYTDEDLQKIASKYFAVIDFKRITLDDLEQSGLHFQRLILRKQ